MVHDSQVERFRSVCTQGAATVGWLDIQGPRQAHPGKMLVTSQIHIALNVQSQGPCPGRTTGPEASLAIYPTIKVVYPIWAGC